MAIPPAGRILAVDWGEVRIGLARSDETQTLASPLDTLVRRRGRRFPMPAFLAHVETERPVGVIVGLPLTPEGGEAAAAGAARALGDLIARRTGLPVELVDERMTTARTRASIREQGGSTRGRREEIDAHAAATLLQHYLETRRHAGAGRAGSPPGS
ncbi:MAG: Holliday junction resolvase RuvX [Gemmatimonadales bacterium]